MFGTTPTGTLVANMPVLSFCVAFGLSMDNDEMWHSGWPAPGGWSPRRH